MKRRRKIKRPMKKMDGIKVFALLDEKAQDAILDGLLEEGLRRGDVELIDGIPRPTVQGYQNAVAYAEKMGREILPMSDRLKAKMQVEQKDGEENGGETL